MFDMMSYEMGKRKGIGEVEITSDMTFTDDGEGNLTVTTGEEVENNG